MFSFADLDAALDSSSAHRPSSKSKQAHKAPAEQAAAGLPSIQSPCSPELPEYALYAMSEADACEASRSSKAKDLQHVDRLLQQYQQQTAAGSSSAQGQGADSDGETYAPEEYEKDSIRGVDPAYVKFNKRLQRSPEQCVRYRFNGEPVWPNSSKPEVPVCSRCGSSRVLELQLMPALIQLTLEAYEQLSGAELQRCQASQPGVAAWEWSTVAVYTCSKSCSRADACSAGISWSEEHVVAVNEDECHDLSVYAKQAAASSSMLA